MVHRSLLLSLGLVTFGIAHAQSQHAIPRNIFEALDGAIPGEGQVTIIQPAKVRALVGHVSSRYGMVLGKEGNATLVQGYRIQFYNSNLPNAKTEAHSRATQIRKVAAGLGVYISFKAPFWRLSIGDFQSYEEANNRRRTIVSQLPSWANEAYVVRDRVRILNYTPTTPHETE